MFKCVCFLKYWVGQRLTVSLKTLDYWLESGDRNMLSWCEVKEISSGVQVRGRKLSSGTTKNQAVPVGNIRTVLTSLTLQTLRTCWEKEPKSDGKPERPCKFSGQRALCSTVLWYWMDKSLDNRNLLSHPSVRHELHNATPDFYNEGTYTTHPFGICSFPACSSRRKVNWPGTSDVECFGNYSKRRTTIFCKNLRNTDPSITDTCSKISKGMVLNPLSPNDFTCWLVMWTRLRDVLRRLPPQIVSKNCNV